MTTRRTDLATAYERVVARCVWVGECFVFIGAKHPSGYGKIGFGGQTKAVHRVVYEHHFGPIPDGLEVDHVAAKGCTSRACCNPLHLEAVTHSENRRRSRKATCRNGHPMSGPNLIEKGPEKNRACRACDNARQRAYRAARSKARNDKVLD